MNLANKLDEMLTNYQELKRSLGLLIFRIENFSKISAHRTIEELTYTTPDGERVSTSGVSDKTARIALAYQGVTDTHNDSIFRELNSRYKSQKHELDMLEYCISLLPNGLSELITDMVIHNIGIAQLSEKHRLSRTSVRRQRKKAVSELVGMYKEIAGEKDQKIC